MAADRTLFETYMDEELNKYRGVSMPRKSGLLRRLLVRHANVKKLHPNPEDEFCDPRIGPGYGIVSDYEKRLRRGSGAGLDEPLCVERMYPDGYLILNGHHRWAAAVRMNLHTLPVRVVNLTHEADLKEMLENAKHDKRVALDLDEVVLVSGPGEEAERPLPFPLNKRYPERLRRGIPALFHALKKQGYDLWVYTQSYHSMEHIRHLFLFSHAPIDGVVTGLVRKARLEEAHQKRLEGLVADRYPRTVHIDRDSVLCIDRRTRTYRDLPLTKENWSRQVMDVIGGLDKDEEKDAR